MKKAMFAVTVLLAFAVVIGTSCGKSNDAVTVRISAAGSLEKVTGMLCESYKPDNKGIKFTFDYSDSDAAVKSVSDGRSDAAFTDRPLTDDEVNSGLTSQIFGRGSKDSKKELFIVFRSDGAKTPAVKSFSDYITSGDTESILSLSDYVPA